MDDETKTPAPADAPDPVPAPQAPSKPKTLHVAWLITVSVAAGLALVIAIMAWGRSTPPSPGPVWQPQHQQSGTWMCESPTGQQTAVTNIGNCGPDDLALWCREWETHADGSGECVG